MTDLPSTTLQDFGIFSSGLSLPIAACNNLTEYYEEVGRATAGTDPPAIDEIEISFPQEYAL